MAQLAGKDALLHWSQQRTQPYRRCGVAVENLASSFADGRAFVALVHSQWPDAIPHPQTLAPEDAQANLTLAFDVAEAKGVFKLLDAELIASSGKPDAKTVMTYLAELRKQIRKAEGVSGMMAAAPLRSASMPAMSAGGGSAADDVMGLLAGVDLSTLKRPSRPKAAGAAPPDRPRAKTMGPPAIPKNGGPPVIPGKKAGGGGKKAVIPKKAAAPAAIAAAAAVSQTAGGVVVSFDQKENTGGDAQSNAFQTMRMYELKAECRKRGLPDTGDKDELLAHLELAGLDELDDV